jgi:glutamyl-tRNA reductase
MSHRSAPVDVLERVACDTDTAIKLAHRVLDNPYVSESVVLSTCNRVEVYVETERFHGSIDDVSALVAEYAGITRDEFVRHVYVHYDDAAVAHAFDVASGLDSMIVGESQILGQVRHALHQAQAESTLGPALNALFQQALRIGKRGHAETDIDQLAPSLVTAGFDAAGDVIAAPGTRFLVAGAGAMASLAVRTLTERGVEPERIEVANRTIQRAFELVAAYGVSAVRWDDLDTHLHNTDVLVTCTGSAEVVFDADRITQATADGRAMTLVDLALPRDVAPEVRALDHVTVIDLEVLAGFGQREESAEAVRAVRDIVAGEVGSFLIAKSAAQVTPTVVALRSMATEVVGAELERLASRLPELSPSQIDEVQRALGRVADKLIHAPTVRVKELADGPEGLTYATALADLFALDPQSVSAVADLRPADEVSVR